MAHRKTLRLVVAFCASMVLAGAPAGANDSTWKGPPGAVGDWFAASNWTNGVPVELHSWVLIDNGGTALVAGGATASGINVTVGGVSNTGTGSILQTGGVFQPTGGFRLAGALGTYTLNDGRLKGGVEFIGVGDGAEGRFIQNGGTNGNEAYIRVGLDWGKGTYELNGGVLSTWELRVGSMDSPCSGTIIQTGGSATAAVILEAHGTYDLRGGTLLCYDSYSAALAIWYGARFLQSGGDLIVMGRLSPGSGHYEISGGTLTTDRVQVGYDVDPASFTIANSLAAVKIKQKLSVVAQGSIEAVPGSVIHMAGAAFDNASTSAAALAGLENLTMIFEGAPAAACDLEVAGVDLGPDQAGLESNFAQGAIRLGGAGVGKVRLVNANDNRPAWAGTECLYVESLYVGPGSQLDLNGYKLYCGSMEIDPAAIILNGSPQLLPEPATLGLLALAGVGLLRGRRRPCEKASRD